MKGGKYGRVLIKTVEEAVVDLLKSLSFEHGFDLCDSNFDDTPKRVAKSYRELLSGYSTSAADILGKSFPSEDYDQMIVVKDICFSSICAHHMLPFTGKIAVGYIPFDGKVVGLSKLARICHVYAKRFQLQERMTQQIAQAIQDHLNPRGVGVVAYDSSHMCMSLRGVKDSEATMTTSTLFGEFRNDPAVRNEFMSLAGLNR